MKRLLSLFALLLVTISAMAQSNWHYATKTEISYTQSSDSYARERCKLDVYYPTDGKDAPIVVWFHGGGLTGGERFVPEELMNAGLVVVSVNYRLMPRAAISDCIDDAACAVAWAFKHAAEYNGSASKVYVTGHSAGGYLTSMIGLDKQWMGKYGVDANAIAALLPLSGQAITHFALREQQGIPAYQATIDAYAPLTFVRPDASPMLVISGDRNEEMNGRYEEQAYFWRMLKLCGHPKAWLYEMQGFNHGEMYRPGLAVVKKYIRAMEEGREWK